jgi:hypothetical protein
MTAIDAPPPPSPAPDFAQQALPIAAIDTPKAPVSVLAIVSFALAALTCFAYLTVKTLVPIFDAPTFDKQVDGIAVVFGILGLLSIVPIAAIIVLGHLGIRRSTAGRRGRALGVAALAVGYLLLALYFNRLIVAAIAVVSFPHGTSFLENNFFWA